MKSKLVAAALLFTSAACFGQQKNISVQQTYYTSLNAGKLGEYVYELDSTDGQYKKLSQLDWEQRPSATFGTGFDISFFNITLSPSFNWSMPASSGSMYDSDWLDLTDVKNCYSISNNNLVVGLGTQLFADYTFRPAQWIFLKPALGVQYNFESYRASGGYGWYGDSGTTGKTVNVSYDDPAAVYFGEGNLGEVGYERQTLYTWLGLKTRFNITERFSINAGWLISPYTYIFSIDRHYSVSSPKAFTLYNDRMNAFFMLNRLDAGCEVKLNQHCSLFVNAQGTLGSSLIGESYFGNGTDSSSTVKIYKSSSYSKCDQFTFNANMGIKLNLL